MLRCTGPSSARLSSASAVLFLVFCSGCDYSLFIYEKHLTGPYYLIAGDALGEMRVAKKVGDTVDDFSVYTSLIGPTVVAVAWDNRFIIAVVPRIATDPGLQSAAAEDYYILVQDGDKLVGPLTKSGFDQSRANLGLPNDIKLTRILSLVDERYQLVPTR